MNLNSDSIDNYLAKDGGNVANVRYPVWPGVDDGGNDVINFFPSRCVLASFSF